MKQELKENRIHRKKHRKIRLQLKLEWNERCHQVSNSLSADTENYIPDSCRLADILQELAAVSIKLVNCMDMSANKAIF